MEVVKPTSPDGKVVKHIPAELMEDTGTGLDFGTRPDRMPGYLTPTDRFYIRSHAPTPHVDPATWTLRVGGTSPRISPHVARRSPRSRWRVWWSCPGRRGYGRNHR
jgi:hypothetical protein